MARQGINILLREFFGMWQGQWVGSNSAASRRFGASGHSRTLQSREVSVISMRLPSSVRGAGGAAVGVLCVLALATYVAVPVSAQSCAALRNQTVAPVSFEEVITPLRKLAPKDEFETTAQYDARVAAAVDGLSGRSLIISKPSADARYLKYDADNGVLKIEQFAFGNPQFDFYAAMFVAGLHERLDVGTSQNVGVVLAMSDTTLGSVSATNGFGAKFDVEKVRRATDALFERANDPRGYDLFASGDSLDALPMDIAAAREFKTAARVAFVVRLKSPYIATGTRLVARVTSSSPKEIIEDFRIIIADIDCALLLDGSAKVIGSYKTR